MSRSEMPPKKRNWTAGTYQLGVFVRTPAGATLELVDDRADEERVKRVLVVLGLRDESAAEVAP